MSGHSKWANIKRKKGVEDAKKGSLFTKIARDITIAAKQGGGDVDSNPSLRIAIEKAKSSNMAKKNIERAVEKGIGIKEGGSFIECTYEGYGSFGVAVLIQCITDNKNRTVAQIRRVFSEFGGSIGDPGSVNYIFKNGNEPLFTVDLKEDDYDKVISLVGELEENDDIVEIRHNAKLI